MTRALKPEFYNEFKNGCFTPLIDMLNVKNGKYKSRFMMNLRGNRVIVYYKGVVAVTIYNKTKQNKFYGLEVQKMYETGISSGYRKFYKSEQELSSFHWEQFLSNIADGIDAYDKKDNSEKEVQQRIWYENNVARNANSTDYFIVDTEYKDKNGGRFDLIAFYWPSGENKQGHKEKPKKISVLELKFGDNAIGGSSNKQTATLSTHLQDFKNFGFSDDFLKDMTCVFFQLYDLGLINIKFNKKLKKLENLISSTDIKQMMFILANYNQKSNNLTNQQNKMKKQTLPDDREIVFANSSFMGYGLYDVGMKHSL